VLNGHTVGIFLSFYKQAGCRNCRLLGRRSSKNSGAKLFFLNAYEQGKMFYFNNILQAKIV